MFICPSRPTLIEGITDGEPGEKKSIYFISLHTKFRNTNNSRQVFNHTKTKEYTVDLNEQNRGYRFVVE